VCSISAPSRTDELRFSAELLSSAKTEDDGEASTNLKLLADIRSVWSEGTPNIASAALVEKLLLVEDSPWIEYKMTARKIAKWLRPFGVVPRNVRIGQAVVKGYQRGEIESVFKRYLSLVPVGSVTSATSATSSVNTGEMKH
jgi:Protein of unknown function (DUF3631)